MMNALEQAKHDRIVAEKDAEIARIKALWQKRGKFHHQDGCCCRFEDDGETQTAWCANHAMMRDEIAMLRAERDRWHADANLMLGFADLAYDVGACPTSSELIAARDRVVATISNAAFEDAARAAERDCDWTAFGKAGIEEWDGGPDSVRDYRLGIRVGRAIAAAIRALRESPDA